MIKVTTALTVLLAAGCVRSSHSSTHGPDGEPGWFVVECNHNISVCYDEAGDTCPSGYDVADREGHVGVVVGKNFDGSPLARSTFDGSMIIKCHAKPEKAPVTSPVATATPTPPQSPIETAIPNGFGWTCFRSKNSAFASCLRTTPECEASRADLTKKVPGSVFGECEPQGTAACHTAFAKLQKTRFGVCYPRLSDCNAGVIMYRTTMTEDFSQVSDCGSFN